MNIFILSIVLFLYAFLVNPTTWAQEKESSKETVPVYVKYDLAFPGILPDHPFYNIKVLRDRFVADAISDPVKKIEFYLKQTDKGILAAAMLVDKHNVPLARETALKAEHNMTLLTYELYRLTSKQDDAFFTRLKTAAAKHQEVLGVLMGRVGEADQQIFGQVIEFSKRNVQTIEEYQARPEDRKANPS